MVRSGQSKVGELAGHALVCYQNVLGLQISVVNSNGMAVLHGIQNLEEGPLGKSIIPEEPALFCDVGEEIALRAILDDNICAVGRVQDLDQGDNIGVSASLVVELNLSLLELLLSGLQAKLVQRLDSIWSVGLHVHGCVNNSIGSNSEDASQLQPSGKNLAKSIFRRTESIEGW